MGRDCETRESEMTLLEVLLWMVTITALVGVGIVVVLLVRMLLMVLGVM